MGRPSLAATRTEQIVSATLRCIDRIGLSRTSLERVAEESGLSRSHIRHYVENRDALMRLAWERIASRYFDACAPSGELTGQAAAQACLNTALGVSAGLGTQIWDLLAEGVRDRAIAQPARRTLIEIERLVTGALGDGAMPPPFSNSTRLASTTPPTYSATELVDEALGRAVRRALHSGVTTHSASSARPDIE